MNFWIVYDFNYDLVSAGELSVINNDTTNNVGAYTARFELVSSSALEDGSRKCNVI